MILFWIMYSKLVLNLPEGIDLSRRVKQSREKKDWGGGVKRGEEWTFYRQFWIYRPSPAIVTR